MKTLSRLEKLQREERSLRKVAETADAVHRRRIEELLALVKREIAQAEHNLVAEGAKTVIEDHLKHGARPHS
jgi:predicted RNase H-like nuclease